MNRYKDIGAAIRTAREEAGLSQKQLAAKIGRDSATAIYLMEVGKIKVSIVDLEKIAKALDRDIDHFLREGSPVGDDVRVALRSDPNLGTEDKKAIMHFIEMAKNRKKRKDE